MPVWSSYMTAPLELNGLKNLRAVFWKIILSFDNFQFFAYNRLFLTLHNLLFFVLVVEWYFFGWFAGCDNLEAVFGTYSMPTIFDFSTVSYFWVITFHCLNRFDNLVAVFRYASAIDFISLLFDSLRFFTLIF